MSSTDTATEPPAASLSRRADAQRNREKLIGAAREAFAEGGTATSLEEIARRAHVGIGTLYRNFPNRQALLEAVYVEEVAALCRTAVDLADLPPWEALVGWFHRFVAYMATKQALAQELLAYVDRGATLFHSCRTELYAAGEPLLRRAQEAGVVRMDAELAEVIQMVAGIAKIQASEPGQVERILDIALDGLRYRAPGD
jgi:AcrR family transcriptional regulator